MKRVLAITLAAALFVIAPPAYAAKVTPGSSCKKVGSQQSYKGKIYTCIKLGKKLYWDNGKKKSVFPSALAVTIKFSAGMSKNPSWMGLPFSCVGSPDSRYSETILDLPWQLAQLRIFDGSGNLIGVPDYESRPKLLADQSCSISFEFSNLTLKSGPIVMKSGSNTVWNVPESSWIKGAVELSGDGASFRPGN